MTPKQDYSCEIIALIVLTVLSALSQFWYIMIAICVVMGFVAAALLLSRIYLRAQSEILARLLNPPSRKITEGTVDMARRARPSLPVS